MSMRDTRVGSALFGVTLLLAACAGEAQEPASTTADQTQASQPVATPTSVAPSSEATEATDPAESIDPATVDDRLRFEASTSAGAAFSGIELAGKDSILWFWASWCPTCQAEAPAVAEAIKSLPEGVTLYGVPGKSESADIQAFIDDYGLGDMVHIVDVDGSLWSNFDVPYQPAYTFIDDAGEIRTVQGSLGKDALLEAAADLAAN